MSQLKARKKILLLCPYPEGVAPGQRLKYEQYLDFLRGHGYDIEVSPFLDKSTWQILYRPGFYPKKIWGVLRGYVRRLRDLARTPGYDGVYIFLHATPFGGPFFERIFRLLAKRVVYDIDDLVFLGKTSPANRVTAWLKSPAKYNYLLRKSNHVITCTPYLDNYARRFNTSTTDISSTIRTETYLPRNSYVNSGTITLGWSGSHSTVPYLNLLAPVLQRLSAKHDIRLRVIGTDHYDLEGVRVKATAWAEATEVNDLQEIDIGLYPLPDEEWVYGKSGLKALQYMALGIPTVAAAIGANFRVIEHGVSGYLARTEDEWMEHLERLIEDANLRRRLGAEARARVERYYSVSSNRQSYLHIFNEVFGK